MGKKGEEDRCFCPRGKERSESQAGIADSCMAGPTDPWKWWPRTVRGHWGVERCPEATSHESSQVWLQVWRFFFAMSWEHNSRVFSTGCFFNCYNTLASSILTHEKLYLPLSLFSRHLQFLQDLRAQEFTRLGTGTQIGETSGNESCEYRQPRRGRTRKTTSVGSTSQGNELVVLWKYVKVTVFFKT